MQSIKNFKKYVGALFVHIITIDKSGREVMLIDSSEEELYLPPGYILRDKPYEIVSKTFKQGNFIGAQYINNSWGEYLSFYYPLKNSNTGKVIGIIGMDLDLKYFNEIQEITKNKIESFIIKFSTSLYLLALLTLIVFIFKFSSPIKNIEIFLDKISQGNLSEKLEYYNETNEFSSIQNIFIYMIENTKKILKSVISTSKEIHSTFIDIESKKTDIVSKISNINELTSTISKSNEKILLNTNNVKNEIFSFNSSISKMIKEIFDTKEISENTKKIYKCNSEKIESFILEIEPLIEKFENFRAKTIILNELSSEIKQILKEIHDIATQTKLLSLNASIVAASAGEHGDGFAVVSQEIGDLSYKSSQSVSTIQDTLATIIKIISFMNTDTITTSAILKEQAIKSSIFSKNISSINKLIEKMSLSFESISEKSTILSDKNDLMLSSIKYINDNSKSNNFLLKSISKSTKQLSDISEYFKIEFKKINKYIKNIRDSYKVFKIKKEEE
ncbi:methyl-accepting chemotaxis protein [Candidatus Arthromitus sp. SFB-rat-Yit]|uniref:methyl-accepting chemotaxis protein n=1 Tax=Candidatus Arthromitus sp. SFB-rat-Yit TaxID=1041504 RepID=UPI001FA6F62C|nr:methyl-accepting chemotaxis protein [Candidatus Arthromitus sp. SFB-rat-Yit]